MSSVMSPVVNSLIYSNKRRTATEVFPPTLRKLWKAWDLRGLVLLSLILQVALIILGNRRKYSHNLRIRFVVWSGYLAADYVASCALGVLSNNLADIRHNGERSLDANIELTALWAPFLLLHLGGPDTITAYALEDNELWLRHLLGLIFQAGTAFYVLLMAWTGSYLSIIFISMFLAGLIKYGERTWVLRLVSSRKLVESTLNHNHHSSLEPTHEQRIKSDEGHHVKEEKLTESILRVDFSVSNDNSISEEDSLCIAYGFFELTKRFFLDTILSSHHKDSTVSVFKHLSSKSAFKVIETELGFIYDMFYTKAPLLHSWLGLGLRLITFLLICLTFSVLIIFSILDHKHKYSKTDISTTFLLFAGAIILEIYSALVLVSSDRFVVWLSKHNKISTPAYQTLSSFPLFKSLRWANTMSQYSFLNYCLKVKPLPYHKWLKLLNLENMLETGRYVVYKEVTNDLKDLVFSYCKREVKGKGKGKRYSSVTSTLKFEEFKFPNLEEELGKSILFWHIVTEVLYYKYEEEIKHSDDNAISQRCESTKGIYEYMLYLLVANPSMLSTGNHHFQATVDQAMSIVKGKHCKTVKEASEALIKSHQHQQFQDTSTLSLLPEALTCAEKLSERNDNDKQFTEIWGSIGDVWLEILTYAARKCNRNNHAQQLRNGGELLTHVWLLMAHFGLTDNFLRGSHETL